MSSSNNNNGNNSYDEVNSTFQAVFDSSQDIKAACDTLNDSLKTIKDRVSDLAKKLNQGDIKDKTFADRVVRMLNDLLKLQYDIKGSGKTTPFNNDVADKLRMALENFPKVVDDKVVDKLLTGLSNIYNSAIVQSNRDEATGKEPIFRGTLDNKKLKGILDEAYKKMGLKLDSWSRGILTFFGDLDKENQKKRKNIADYLIEGLAANKFVGGALNDTFKLIGLLGANWLSKFGQLGRILGGAFYVTMSAFGPVLSKLIVEGIGRLILMGSGSIVKAIWASKAVQSIGQGVGNLIYKTNGPLMDFISADKASKLKATGNLAKAAGFSLAYGAGALWAGKESIDAWKKGKKGQSVSFGVGAGALGAAAIAALLAGPLASITLTLVGIGVAVTALTMIWKHFGGDISGWFKNLFRRKDEEKERDKEEKGFWQRFWDWLKDWWPFGKKGGGGGPTGPNATVGNYNWIGGGTTAELLKGKQKGGGDRHLDLAKMTQADWDRANNLQPKYGKMGEIVNLGQMSQKRASEVIAADIKAKGKKSFYELVPKELVSMGSFATDAKALDGSGIYLARGMKDKFLDMRTRLAAQGYDTSNTKITGGIGTLGSPNRMSPHVYTDSITGHFSSLGTTIDITPIYKKGTKERLSDAGLRRAQLGNYYLYSEGDHEHMSFKMLQWQKDAKEGKVQATQHSISAEEALKKVDKEAYERTKRSAEFRKEKNPEKDYKKILETMGYKWDEKAQDYVHKTKGGTRNLTMLDPTGNPEFMVVQQTMNRTVMYGTNDYC